MSLCKTKVDFKSTQSEAPGLEPGVSAALTFTGLLIAAASGCAMEHINNVKKILKVNYMKAIVPTIAFYHLMSWKGYPIIGTANTLRPIIYSGFSYLEHLQKVSSANDASRKDGIVAREDRYGYNHNTYLDVLIPCLFAFIATDGASYIFSKFTPKPHPCHPEGSHHDHA